MKDILEIDINRLEEEWMNQPRLYLDWANQLSDAREEQDRLKREMDVMVSELDLSIRQNPSKFGLPDKTTEVMIKSAILRDESLQNFQDKCRGQKHDTDILQNAVAALDQRKRALEKLVDLHGQKYFATPRPSEQSREAVEEFQKRNARTKRGKKVRRRDQS